MLQVWGIVFLIWAAMIVARSLFLQFVPGSGPTSRSNAVSSVVSVLLLVPAPPPSSCWSIWAATFVDFGRQIHAMRVKDPRRQGPIR